MKLDFWNKLAAKDSLDQVSSFWLPAFFRPDTFLHSLGQTRSRNEFIPIREISNQYEIQTFMTATKPCKKKFSLYFHGLWLQGANWDTKNHLLVEQADRSRFTLFPVIMLTAHR